MRCSSDGHFGPEELLLAINPSKQESFVASILNQIGHNNIRNDLHHIRISTFQRIKNIKKRIFQITML
jgi:hypothetical protein